MRPISWIRNLFSAVKQRRCLHEWAPGQTHSGWVCVRCGLREDTGASGGEVAVPLQSRAG